MRSRVFRGPKSDHRSIRSPFACFVVIYRELQSYGIDVSCYDPEADRAEVKHEYGIELLAEAPQKGPFDALILAVKHRSLLAAYPWEKIQSLGGPRPPVVIDVKGFTAKRPDIGGAVVWQL